MATPTMIQPSSLSTQFDSHRTHLQSVAYRLLGSATEAEDAVQEAWLRLQRSDVSDVDNLAGWLTTVVARIAIDMLRTRNSRRESPLDEQDREHVASTDSSSNPQLEIEMAESVGLALMVVLQTLSPAERIAFVMHDMFDFPFEQIAPIVGRTPVATRQLASRARRRVQGKPSAPRSDVASQRKVVDAFLAASRGGQFEQLLTLLDPDVVLRGDHAAQQAGAFEEIRGAEAVARFFLGRAVGAQTALVDGEVGAVVAPGGQLRLAVRFEIESGQIAGINAMAAPENLSKLEISLGEGEANQGRNRKAQPLNKTLAERSTHSRAHKRI